MIRQLRDVRLSRLALVAVAVVSALATAVVISGAGDRTSAEVAAAAALRGHAVRVVTDPTTTGAVTAASTPAASSPSVGSSGSGGAVSASSVTGAGDSSTPSDLGSGGGASGTGGDGTTPGASNGTSNSTTTGTTPTTPTVPADLPKIKHVFEIALSTTSYASAFGPQSSAPYLRSLVRNGALLSGFHSLGSGELADNLALVSGQGPDPDTTAGCTKYAEFPTGATAKSDGLVAGNGCIYPETALTIGDQVSSSGHVWRAYIADMGKQECAHPNSNAAADGELPGTEPGYDTTHNPFIYFHSLLDLGDCASDDLDLSHLQPALAHASGAPTLSFIAPGQCEDAAASANDGAGGSTSSSTTTSTTSTTTASAASATTTSTTSTSTTTTSTTTTGTTPLTSPATQVTCPAGQPVGVAAEDAFLRQWVPRILAAPAYRAGGMLLIVFTGAGEGQGQRPVRTGALVLSPYARRGTTITRSYGPYSVLRCTEQLLAYTPLAHAKSAPSFASAALRKHG